MGILTLITFMNSEKTDLEKLRAGITLKMHPFHGSQDFGWWHRETYNNHRKMKLLLHIKQEAELECNLLNLGQHSLAKIWAL